MQKIYSFLLSAFLLLIGVSSVWGTDITYTFTTKDWDATSGGSAANWTSGKDGNQLTSGQGIQVTTGVTGANGTSPSSFSNVSKIEIQYCTNASKGAGTIKVQVGEGTEKSFSVTKPSSGGTTLKTATFNFSPTESGNIKITVDCTENSVYVYSATITYTPAASFTLTATSNNDTYGTVSVTGATITATPASGYRVSTSTPYDVTSGTATVSQSGNVFTVTASADCTVRINFEAIPTYAVTIETPTGGTLSVKKGDDDVTSGDELQDGTVLTITATAGTDYNFRNWQAVDASTHTYTASNTGSYTINGRAVTFKANFDAKVYHDAIFKTTGGTTYATKSTEEGQPIEFPDDPDDYSEDIVFMGWVADAIVGTTDEEPTFVTSANMGDADITYYACYAEKSTDEGEVTKSFGFETESDDDWTIDGPSRNSDYKNSGSYSGKINTNNTYVTFNNKVNVTSFSFAFTRTSSNDNYNVYIETSSNNSSWTAAETYAMSSFNSNGTFTTKEKSFDGKTALYVRFHCSNTTAARYVDDVSITYNSSVTTYSDYCTTVNTLPRPVITLSTYSIDMTWGDEDKVLTASALLSEEPFEGSITMTSSSANLTIDGSGNIRCNVPGDYTITASIDATEDYQAAKNVVCNISVGKQTPTLSFADATIQKLTSDGSYTQAATKSADGVSAPTYAISPSGNTINSSTGAVTLTITGNYTITATAAANTLYNAAEASYTLQIRTTPTITLSDKEIAFGETLDVDDEFTITGGSVSVTSANSSVATTSGTVITSIAVGSVNITVSTAANDTYIAGSESFTLTITAPEGGTTAKTASLTTTFTSQQLAHAEGELDWTASSDANGYEASRRAQWSNSIADFTLTLTNTDVIKKVTIVASTNGSGNSISTTVGGTAFKNGDATSLSMSSGDSNKEFSFSGSASGNVVVSFARSGNASSYKSIWVKSITIELGKATVSATLNASGYATFCSEYPLDFSGYATAGYSAWQVTSADTENGTITFSQVTGTIKGGEAVLLKGEANANISIPSANSTNVLSENKLVGCLAKTYLREPATSTKYGLVGNQFQRLDNYTGYFLANRAYLDLEGVELAPSAFRIVFEENNATSLESFGESEQAVKFFENGRLFIRRAGKVYDTTGRLVK